MMLYGICRECLYIKERQSDREMGKGQKQIFQEEKTGMANKPINRCSNNNHRNTNLNSEISFGIQFGGGGWRLENLQFPNIDKNVQH